MAANLKRRRQSRAKREAKTKDLNKDPVEMIPDLDKEIEDTFVLIDTDGDGRISKEEMVKAASLMGFNPTSKDADTMIKMADADGDGFINCKEYCSMMSQNYSSKDQEKQALQKAFETLDRDGDGFLTTEELRAALQYNSDITDDEIEIFFMEADTDGNGKIDYTEFIDSTLCVSLV
ncbi:calmodulin-beta-like [Pecten maximus]|uniref:calmodulin-beta-like n=1 Tax=Pecten maximus TaxID=6579 RepID=UPI0014589130|nr:calmodulin-beta-like [Pecten maximus]